MLFLVCTHLFAHYIGRFLVKVLRVFVFWMISVILHSAVASWGILHLCTHGVKAAGRRSGRNSGSVDGDYPGGWIAFLNPTLERHGKSETIK